MSETTPLLELIIDTVLRKARESVNDRGAAHSPRHIERGCPLHVHSSLDAISTSFDDVGVFYGNDYEERIQS
jgi:hypothetical protein